MTTESEGSTWSPKLFHASADTDQAAPLVPVMACQAETPGLEQVRATKLQLLALQGGEQVLDVGCGPGHDSLAFAWAVAPSGHVLGVDVSAVMVAEAQRRAAGTELPVTYQLGDIMALDLPEAHAEYAVPDRCAAETTAHEPSWPGFGGV
jgi:SAM-dependent methyltransferase